VIVPVIGIRRAHKIP